jgi:hypothetical protein
MGPGKEGVKLHHCGLSCNTKVVAIVVNSNATIRKQKKISMGGPN